MTPTADKNLICNQRYVINKRGVSSSLKYAYKFGEECS